MTKQELYQKACALPLLPGVYIIRNKQQEIIYIGKAKRLRTRVSQYFREGVPHDAKVTQMIRNAFEFDVIVTTSEFEALVLEASQIKTHMPKYNILLKDDKGYSYVRISKGPWSRVTAALQKEEDGAEYLGPYTSGFAVREMVETANIAFKLPTCNRKFPQDFRKGRPCLNAHIGRCMAVCTGKIKQEQYQEAVNGAVRMIRLGKAEILKSLRQRMEEAAERLDFEKAALLRDQIAAIEKVMPGQRVVTEDEKEQDVIAFAGAAGGVCAAILRFRQGKLSDKKEFLFKDTLNIDTLREEFLPRYYLSGGEIPPKVIAVDAPLPDQELLCEALTQARGSKVKLYTPERGDNARLVQMAYVNAVERLARENSRSGIDKAGRLLDETAHLLGLKEAPHIIESYDISNWGDGTSVGGMIVFEDGKPKKSGYRKFKIRSVLGTDDYGSMAEVLTRRVQEYKKGTSGQFGEKPDLILLDGGKGQVSVVKRVLQGTPLQDVPLFGMVKDDKHRTRAIVTAQGEEIAISMHKGVFGFITSIQDEVHRFSIQYQRQSQKKKSYASSLTQIAGVGPATAKALLNHFRSVGAVRQATIEELQQVKGLSKKVAQNIWEEFHPADKQE